MSLHSAVYRALGKEHNPAEVFIPFNKDPLPPGSNIFLISFQEFIMMSLPSRVLPVFCQGGKAAGEVSMVQLEHHRETRYRHVKKWNQTQHLNTRERTEQDGHVALSITLVERTVQVNRLQRYNI